LEKQLDFYCCNQHLILHHNKSVFWVEQQILLLADLHLGKDAHFRKAGLAIPQVITNEDLNRLQQLISYFKPRQVLFLGDLFHSDYNLALEVFRNLIKLNSAIDFLLVKGNHDIIGQTGLNKLGLTKIYDNYTLDPFSFSHYPIEEGEHYNFSGHLHPGIIIKGKGRQGIRLPVFYFTKQQAVLPAFGSFNGKFIVKPEEEDNIFAISNEAVFKI